MTFHPCRVLLVASLLAFSGWSLATAVTCNNKNISATTAISNACFNLFTAVLPNAAAKPTFFISPLSIVYAMTLAENGAGSKSSTQLELRRFLSAKKSPISEKSINTELQRVMYQLNGLCGPVGAQVVLANSIWTAVNATLKPDYVGNMQTLFNATARVATNGAADINDWVEAVTQGLIKDLIKDDNFLAVLANAVYFNARWSDPFDYMNTVRGSFATPSGNKDALFMNKLFGDLKRASKPGWYEAVALPYEGGKFSAIALLPSADKTVQDVVEDWSAKPRALAPMGPVRLSLPRFDGTSEASLKSVLKTLGVKKAFGPGQANFSRLTDVPVFVGDVVHKVSVAVGENGTVAAAATGVIMVGASPFEPPLIRFDRPFAFIVMHNPSKLPLFAGVVNDPSAPPSPGSHRRSLRASFRG